MGPLGELFATGERQTLDFFYLHLKDVCESGVDRLELLYTASVLAHHALVSTRFTDQLATPATLGAVLDHFVLDTTLLHDGVMMESAGAQCLVFAGFFQDQMRGRHNIRWYAGLGASFYSRAADLERSEDKARLLNAIAEGFEPWRRRCVRLSRDLRDRPYLLPTPSSSTR
jgi:hypothetical protein